MDFLTLAKDRYSCRKLTGEVEQEKIDAILEAASAAPTAKNLQPYRIWVVQSEEGVEKIGQITPCGFGAKLFFVVGADQGSAWVRAADQRNFADVDAAIVATHILLAVHDLGLRTTWVGNFDAPALQALFPEMGGYDLVAIFPVGCAAEGAGPSERHTQRKDLSETVKYL